MYFLLYAYCIDLFITFFLLRKAFGYQYLYNRKYEDTSEYMKGILLGFVPIIGLINAILGYNYEKNMCKKLQLLPTTGFDRFIRALFVPKISKK